MAIFTDILEKEELINKLRKHGFGEVIDVILLNEYKIYTKKGRLNKSGACRVLGLKPKQLDDMLIIWREILINDFDEED